MLLGNLKVKLNYWVHVIVRVRVRAWVCVSLLWIILKSFPQQKKYLLVMSMETFQTLFWSKVVVVVHLFV